MIDSVRIIIILQILDFVIKMPIVIKEKKLNSTKAKKGTFNKAGEWFSLILCFICDDYFKLNGTLLSLNTKYIIFSEIISCMENLQEYGINFSWLPDNYKNKLKGK